MNLDLRSYVVSGSLVGKRSRTGSSTTRTDAVSFAQLVQMLSSCKCPFQLHHERRIHMQHLLLMPFQTGRELSIALVHMSDQSCTRQLFQGFARLLKQLQLSLISVPKSEGRE